jgi:hypothetical protein
MSLRSISILRHTFLKHTNMKFTTFSKAFRTISLTTLLTVMVGTNIQQSAQAEFRGADSALMPCSEAYFADVDYMYYDFESIGVSAEQLEEIKKLSAPISEEMTRIPTEVNMFAVELDAPVGYVANKVNGEEIAIPPEIERALYAESFAANEKPEETRKRVNELNKKYGQYATFGQQLTLVFSSEQTRRYSDLIRQNNAIVASVLTEEQKQKFRDLRTGETCNVNYSAAEMGLGSIVVEVGERPELDARLREDTTGAIFFR